MDADFSTKSIFLIKRRVPFFDSFPFMLFLYKKKNTFPIKRKIQLLMREQGGTRPQGGGAKPIHQEGAIG